MNSSKISYSPDYKSEKPDYTDGGRLPAIKEMSGSVNYGGRVVFEDGEPVVLTLEETIVHERARLEREVIRCARLFTKIKDGSLDATWVDRAALADNDLDDAVRKLEAFESEQEGSK